MTAETATVADAVTRLSPEAVDAVFRRFVLVMPEADGVHRRLMLLEGEGSQMPGFLGTIAFELRRGTDLREAEALLKKVLLRFVEQLAAAGGQS